MAWVTPNETMMIKMPYLSRIGQGFIVEEEGKRERERRVVVSQVI